jgi:predicted dinucleotide-binding enzyme
MFYCGDDAGSKATAAQLALEVGFDPIDAGPLANARLLEPYALLWIWLAIRGGFGPGFAFQIVKR